MTSNKEDSNLATQLKLHSERMNTLKSIDHGTYKNMIDLERKGRNNMVRAASFMGLFLVQGSLIAFDGLVNGTHGFELSHSTPVLAALSIELVGLSYFFVRGMYQVAKSIKVTADVVSAQENRRNTFS